ncbi:MAG: hypothetical protein M1830_002035 [Pleopsidium flavum]|nr:MAG: hypothetical protein M1830_002035 [Pleopsidium flavum]
MGVYRDPFCTLKETLRLFSRYPSVASNVRRLWFDGFHVSETSAYIFEILRHCNNLRSITVPSIALRHGTAEDWSLLLGQRSGFGGISSLELLAVDLKESQRSSTTNQVDHGALDQRSVDFSCLTRLKIFGDTNFVPVVDEDLRKMARTATTLQELHITGMSSVTIDGVMALVKVSKDTLRVLEYSPLSKDGFEHPESTTVESDGHLCSILTSCLRLENLSITLPSICSDIFSSDAVKWKGEVQIRTAKLCEPKQNLARSLDVQDQFWKMLNQARSLMASRQSEDNDLHIEIFISHWIFEPRRNVVHGNFELGEVLSDFTWPTAKTMSGKGPYGQTGLYGPGKDEGPYSYVSEEAFREGLQRSYISL